MIWFKFIGALEIANHSFSKRKATTNNKRKIKYIFCKYMIPKMKVAKINAAGNL